MTKLLVADIGGTGSRFAVIEGSRILHAPVSYVNSAYDSLDSILDQFLAGADHRPSRAAFAVAGPVHGNRVQMTNLRWDLSGDILAQRFGFARVELINDFEALAWATESLGETELHRVGSGKAVPLGTRGILGPGTGLGVAGFVHNGKDWAALAGEGGHVTLPAVSSVEAALIEQVVQEFGHCSAERLISGPGLARIYMHVCGESQAPEVVTARALDGEQAALEALEIFSLILGTVASDLALTLGARGGIYLAGGILPAISELFSSSGFRERFEAKGRFAEYLAAIPTFVIIEPHPYFRGLDIYMRRQTDPT